MNPAGTGPRSRALYRRARRSLVGGVDSPVRSFRAVGGTPVFFRSGKGAFLTDVDGHQYLDLVGSWGAAILGHAPPRVVSAVQTTASRGLSFGAPSALEHELAERIRGCVPEIELLRFVSSGTEAVMSAVRVARGYTGRAKVIKFAGGYHGHSDGLLARAGSGVATHALPDSAGVPAGVVRDTIVVPYNDLEALRGAFERHADDVAAVVVEPIAGNMGMVPPEPGFLPGVQRATRSGGALLIADEVITGFRLRKGVVHTELGIRADLVTLGKIIGGGLNVAAYGGRRRIMEMVAPMGPVYQAGTLSGNPVGMAAGMATLDALTDRVYVTLERRGRELERLMEAASAEQDATPFTLNRRGSMLGLFFTRGPVRNFEEARRADAARYARFFGEALKNGVYLPPSPWETTFLNAAIRPSDLEHSRVAFSRAFRASRVEGSR